VKINGETVNYYTECVTTVTPWGKADIVTRYERGVNFYSTPGHGGFKLSKVVNERIPLFIRQESFGGLGLKGWYEEDEDAQIVIVAFGHLFTEKERQHAREYLGTHHPTWLFALERIATVGGTFGSLENIV
jgi:uncharacterized protein DUF7007